MTPQAFADGCLVAVEAALAAAGGSIEQVFHSRGMILPAYVGPDGGDDMEVEMEEVRMPNVEESLRLMGGRGFLGVGSAS
jgi:hypothetical protein